MCGVTVGIIVSFFPLPADRKYTHSPETTNSLLNPKRENLPKCSIVAGCVRKKAPFGGYRKSGR